MALVILSSLPPLVYLIYRTYGVFTLEYWVDRDSVTIIWGPTQLVIPILDIQEIVWGLDTDHSTPPGPWPVPWVGGWRCPPLGEIYSYATRPVGEQVLLVTSWATYGLSPDQPEAFILALQERCRLGPARRRHPYVRRPSWWAYPLWRDRLGLGLLSAALLLNLVLYAIISWQYPVLPAYLPLHFDAQGQVDRVGSRAALFVLPTLGSLSWIVNGLWGLWHYRRQRLAAYLLWGGAILIQVLATMALRGLGVW
jgi:hypothetical protein